MTKSEKAEFDALPETITLYGRSGYATCWESDMHRWPDSSDIAIPSISELESFGTSVTEYHKDDIFAVTLNGANAFLVYLDR